MTPVQAFLLAISLHNNGDAAMIYDCIRDCGKEHGVVVVITDDADSEGIMCECADTPLGG